MLNYDRNNPVVVEQGDSFRDTAALTMRGDGIGIPTYFIKHTYKNASKASARRCETGENPVKGMTIDIMKKYVDHVAKYVVEPTLMVMDRLSSHTSREVLAYIRSKRTKNNIQLLIPILLNPKVAFLISPLDMGAIAAFKSYYRGLDRSTLDLKKKAVQEAWDRVSTQSLVNICLNCGVVGNETLQSLRDRFMDQVVNQVPEEYEPTVEFYDGWVSGAFTVEGAHRGQGVTTEKPQQLAEGYLGGKYWTKFGKLGKP